MKSFLAAAGAAALAGWLSAAQAQSAIPEVPPMPAGCDTEALNAAGAATIGRLNGVRTRQGEVAVQLTTTLANLSILEGAPVTPGRTSQVNILKDRAMSLRAEQARLDTAEKALSARLDEIKARRAEIKAGTCSGPKTGAQATGGAAAAPVVQADALPDPCDRMGLWHEQHAAELERDSIRKQIEERNRQLAEETEKRNRWKGDPSVPASHVAEIETRLAAINRELNRLYDRDSFLEVRIGILQTAVKECDRTSKIRADALGIPIHMAYYRKELPRRRFLGSERPGATAPTLGLADTVTSPSGMTYYMDAEFPLGGAVDFGQPIIDRPAMPPLYFLRLGLGGFDLDGHGEREGGDLLGGQTLVIPGLGVGANGNGFSLGSFGGLNEPRDIAYSRALSGWTGEVDLLRRSRVDGVNIHGGVGVRYDHEEHGLNFEAAIPGFARAVAYDQEIDVAAWSFMLIFGGDLMLDENFRASFEAAFGYVDADFNGFNELRFTGFANQRVEEDSGADGWRYEAELEIEYLLGENVSVGAFARAEGDNVTPYWDTPGGGARSRIETGRSDGYVVGLSLRYYVD